jgi:hypothetical protein
MRECPAAPGDFLVPIDPMGSTRAKPNFRDFFGAQRQPGVSNLKWRDA